MIINVFKNNDGEINLRKGRLATIEDLEEYFNKTGKSINGELQLLDGIYKFVTAIEQRKILELEGATNINEWNFKGGYIKISNEPCLYNEFKNDIDEEIEIIESCVFGNKGLKAVTRLINPNIVYIYEYNKLKDGTIDKKCININKIMLESLFNG